MRKWQLILVLSLLLGLFGCDQKSEETPHAPSKTPTPVVQIVLKPVDDERAYTIEEADEIQQLLEKRANGFTLTQATATHEFQENQPYFTIEFQGWSDTDSTDEIVKMLLGVGLLELVDYSNLPFDLLLEIATPSTCIITDYQIEIGLAQISETGEGTSNLCENPLLFNNAPFRSVLTQTNIANATFELDNSSRPIVNINFTTEGSTRMSEFTETHQGQQLAIVVNGQVISAPTINAVISERAIITGQFTEEEARALAIQLNSALLTIPLEVVELKK